MSCDCKRVKRIQNSIPNANHLNKPKTGINKYFNVLAKVVLELLRKIIILIIVLLMLPIVFILISFNLLFKGSPLIPIPKKLFNVFLRYKNK